MMKSIRKKLMIYLSLLSLCFVVLSVVLTNVFLEKYYISTLEKNLLDKKEIINTLDVGNESYYVQLDKISRESNIQISIFLKDGPTIYSSLPLPPEEHRMGGGRFDLHNQLLTEGFNDLAENEFDINVKLDTNLKVEHLVLRARIMDDEAFLVMSIPINAIEEGVNISNQLFFLIGLVNFVIGIFLAYLISTKITKPIRVLNEHAKKMKDLEFGQTVEFDSEDEIGELGNTINELSQKLDKTLNELKEANVMLEKDNEAKEAIDEMRKTFISDVSHELKTPIALIQGYAEGLVYNVNDDEENKNYYCNVIKDEALKMNQLVKQLLNLSQLESDGINLSKSTFDIVEITNNIIIKYKGLIDDEGIKFRVNTEDEFIVEADEYMVERIIDNYMTNALHHVKNDNVIEITIDMISRDKVRWKIFNSGDHIPADSIENIWQRFFKVDKARTRAFGGTGLGLSIVKAIQERQQNGYGVINVDGGVAFWFDIDVAHEIEYKI